MQLTVILVIINAIVFLVLSFGGMTENASYMLEHGAMYVPYIMENGENYRMFTSMFLHFGISHLINNMLTLVIMGRNVEPVVGKIRFLIIYFLSGFGGNLLSYFGESITQDYVVSAGASGAIFGLTGSLLALTIIYRGRVGQVTSRDMVIIQVTSRDMVIMIVLNLYLGFTSQGVDNLAHIGGLITGFLVTFLLVGIPKSMSRRQR